MNTSFKNKITIGFLWNFINVAIDKSASFILKLVLAKLLFPEQFGLIGMATVFAGLITTINELGIATALIQKKEEDLTEKHLNTAFWTSVVFGIFLFVLMSFVIGPLIAIFYKEPILQQIIPFLSLSLLVRPLIVIHTVKLNKTLDFKRLTIINNLSTIVAGIVSIIMAYSGFGVWSLVMNALINGIIVVPFYWLTSTWRPAMEWDKQAFKDIFGFGIYSLGTSVITYTFNNIDYLLVGKLLGAAALGAYTFAFILTDTFRAQLMNMVNKVMFPVYSLKQHDLPVIKQYYLKIVVLNMLIVYPIMLLFIIYGEEIILILFNNKWREAVIPLKILSFAVLLHMVVNSNTSLIRALGHAKLEMKLQFYKSVIIFIPSIAIGIYFYGIIGAAMAVAFNKFMAIIIAQYNLRKLINLHFNELLKRIGPAILVSLVCLGVGFGVKSMGNIPFYISAILVLIIYAAGVLFFYMKEFKPLIKGLIARPKKAKIVNVS